MNPILKDFLVQSPTAAAVLLCFFVYRADALEDKEYQREQARVQLDQAKEQTKALTEFQQTIAHFAQELSRISGR